MKALPLSLAFITVCGATSAYADDGSYVADVEFEASYTYVGVSRADDFEARGDWNDNHRFF